MTVPSSPSTPPPVRTVPRDELVRWLTVYVGLCVVVGGLGGLFWRLVVRLPEYRLQEGGKAVVTEQGLAAMFSIDAWFVITGVLLGGGLGWAAWRWFRPLGWPLTLVAALGALLAALSCWGFSLVLAPAPFKDRLLTATTGDLVAVDFALHAPVAFLVWPAAAMVPVLVAASFLSDPDDPGARAIDGRALAASAADGGDGGVDEPNQVHG